MVIGIGKQEDSAWNKINGDKDVPYVLEILNAAKYEQIITCVNEEATKAGVITLAVLLTAMGLPTDYIGMFMAIDILCDIPKTLLNAYSVSCSAIIVARSEAEMLKI